MVTTQISLLKFFISHEIIYAKSDVQNYYIFYELSMIYEYAWSTSDPIRKHITLPTRRWKTMRSESTQHTSHYHMLCWLNMLQVYPVHHFIINDKRLCKPQNHIYRAHIFITELIDIWNWFCATYINDNICMCSVHCICSNIKCMLSPGGILLYMNIPSIHFYVEPRQLLRLFFYYFCFTLYFNIKNNISI